MMTIKNQYAGMTTDQINKRITEKKAEIASLERSLDESYAQFGMETNTNQYTRPMTECDDEIRRLEVLRDIGELPSFNIGMLVKKDTGEIVSDWTCENKYGVSWICKNAAGDNVFVPNSEGTARSKMGKMGLEVRITKVYGLKSWGKFYAFEGYEPKIVAL
jgi:hypothetical protein